MTPLLDHLTLAMGTLSETSQSLVHAAAYRDLAKGQPLLREGEYWQHLWWLERGCLRLFFLDRNGHAANKNFYLDGALLWPITPALQQTPVRFWMEAVEPCRIWALPWAAWQTAVDTEPAWPALERRVLARLLEDKMAREQAFLQDTATERYQRLLAEHPDWAARLPLRHLASYLGITDVALSRIRRRLGQR